MGLLVVDGNNVMGARPDGWWRDRRGAARRLVDGLDAWQAVHGTTVLVVFDGRPGADVAGPARPGLEVAFARRPGRDAADDRIVEEVEARYAAEPDLAVATADRGLVGRLPPGVDVVRPRRLLAELDEAQAAGGGDLPSADGSGDLPSADGAGGPA